MWHAVIMAGGSGTRFWPQSRRRLPKQFLSFGSGRTLLQETVARCEGLIPREQTWIVTGREHADETARQVHEVDAARLLLEPCGRNTGPCVGLAALRLLAEDSDAVMLVMPADHVIQPVTDFQQTVRQAMSLVEQRPESLVLFGARPTEPATGFGYIQRGELLSDAGTASRVAAFHEKPDAVKAAAYMASGKHFWNCGIFVWRAKTLLSLLERHAPEISSVLAALSSAVGTARWPAALDAEFPRMPAISIDHAVLEQASEVCVIPATFGWNDVGSWSALSRCLPADARGNVSDGLFCGINTDGCLVRSSSEHLVAAYGVRDLVIVHTPTATLVADKHDENGLRELVQELERQGLTDYL